MHRATIARSHRPDSPQSPAPRISPIRDGISSNPCLPREKIAFSSPRAPRLPARALASAGPSLVRPASDGPHADEGRSGFPRLHHGASKLAGHSALVPALELTSYAGYLYQAPPAKSFLILSMSKRGERSKNALRTLQLYAAKGLTRKSDCQKHRFFIVFSSLFHQNVRLCYTLIHCFPLCLSSFCHYFILYSPVLCPIYPVIPSPLFTASCIAMFCHPFYFQCYPPSPRGGVPSPFFHSNIFFSIAYEKNEAVKTPFLCPFSHLNCHYLWPVGMQTQCSAHPRPPTRNLRFDRLQEPVHAIFKTLGIPGRAGGGGIRRLCFRPFTCAELL